MGFVIGNNVQTYVLFAVIAFFAVMIVYFIIKAPMDAKKEKERQEALLDELDEQCESEPDIIETRCRVTRKQCGTKIEGYRIPQSHKLFIVTFTDEDGKETELPVTEDVYLELNENEDGTLATVNGNFFGFCPDDYDGQTSEDLSEGSEE